MPRRCRCRSCLRSGAVPRPPQLLWHSGPYPGTDGHSRAGRAGMPAPWHGRDAMGLCPGAHKRLSRVRRSGDPAGKWRPGEDWCANGPSIRPWSFCLQFPSMGTDVKVRNPPRTAIGDIDSGPNHHTHQSKQHVENGRGGRRSGAARKARLRRVRAPAISVIAP